MRYISHGCETMSNQPNTEPLKTKKFGIKEKVKVGIYLLVVLYSAWAITLGTTFFNTFDKMLMSGLVTVLTIPIFVWLGIELIQNRKKLEV